MAVTNDPGLVHDLDLSDKNILLWNLYQNRVETYQDLQQRDDWGKFESIFLLEQEIFSNDINDPRVHVWSSTYSDHPQHHAYLWWFESVKIMEEYANHLKLLDDQKNPEYYFDALLGNIGGNHKIHKRIMSDYLENDRRVLFNKRIVKEKHISGGKFDPGPGQQGVLLGNFLFSPGSWTQAIPYKIYNNTWYTLGCESNCIHPMYSEKTAKPLLAKRIFISLGAHHQIKGLQSFGFKTFSRIIDESYDDYEKVEDRCKGAWDQMQYLMEQDPEEMYDKVQDILEHNQNLLTSINLQEQLGKEIWDLIKS